MGSGVTGEVLHVDSGYHAVGMVAVDAAPQVAELLQGLRNKNSNVGQ
jgi:enoyl-[acyl-carrier protein] reductase I